MHLHGILPAQVDCRTESGSHHVTGTRDGWSVRSDLQCERNKSRSGVGTGAAFVDGYGLADCKSARIETEFIL